VGVGIAVGIGAAVGVGVAVGVGEAVGVCEAVGVGIAVGDGVTVGVGVVPLVSETVTLSNIVIVLKVTSPAVPFFNLESEAESSSVSFTYMLMVFPLISSFTLYQTPVCRE
ncbi:hypothetical protein CA596_08760, partial [Paenibacillus odorifer]